MPVVFIVFISKPDVTLMGLKFVPPVAETSQYIVGYGERKNVSSVCGEPKVIKEFPF